MLNSSAISVLYQLDQKIIYPHYDFKHLTEKYFEIGMKPDDFLIQLVKYCKWEDIRKYFPPERVAEIRAKILELRKSGKYTDRELWEMYGMSERIFYDLVERAKDGSTAENLKDRPSKPKNPYRKLTDEDKAEIINLRLDDTNRIESSKLAFFDSMEKTDLFLNP